MDEQTLGRRFDDAVSDEPPLGFDPDDIVLAASRLHRQRRTVLISGVAAAAAVGLAVTVVPHLVSRDAQPAVPSTMMWPSGDSPAPTISNNNQLLGRQLADEAPLLRVWGSLDGKSTSAAWDVMGQPDPTESDAESGAFGAGYEAGTFAYPKNTEVKLDMITRVLKAPVTPEPMSRWCPPATCALSALPGGDILAVDHGAFGNVMLPPAGPDRSVLDVRDFRADGTEVEVRLTVSPHKTNGLVFGDGVPFDPARLPTLAQLEALATNPAWDLTR